MSKESPEFSILYDGEAVSDGSIDVRELSPALMALADLINEVAPLATDDVAPVQLRVKAEFKKGSFEVPLEIAKLYGDFRTLFSGPDATAWSTFFSLIGISGAFGLFQLIRFAKGRKPKTVIDIERTERIRIVFDDGDSVEVEKKLWRLFTSLPARRSVETIVRPLFDKGIDVFKIRKDNKDTLKIEKSEAQFFVAPKEREGERINVSDLQVVLLSPSFKEGNKWRVSTGGGSSPIYVSVEDSGFISKVQSGSEAFRKGDIMDVRLETRQWIENGDLRAEHAITQVFKHESKIQGELL